MDCLSNLCFICFKQKDIVMYVIFQHAENETVQQVKFVLPEITILEPRMPLAICSTCRQTLDAFHNFKKICLDNNCRYNDYINKLERDSGSSKQKFGELEIKINENNVKEDKYTDLNLEEIEAEKNLIDVKETLDFSEVLPIFENSNNPLYGQVLKKEIESDNEQDYDGNIDCVDQIIKDEIKSCGQENIVSDNTLLINLNQKENIVSNIEEQDKATGQFIYQQVLKNEIEPNHEQDCETNDAKCSVCNENFAEKFNLHNHMIMVHTSVKERKCLICHKTFKYATFLRRHMKSHAGIKEFKCAVCNKLFMYRTSLITHKRNNTCVKDYKCVICNKLFGNEHNLYYHVVTHTGASDYKCSICNKSFAFKHKLNIHMRTHTGVKDYKCSICNKILTRKHHLNRHMLIHTGAKDYKCSICNKAFTRKTGLDRHMTIHTGVKDYKCSICNMWFAFKHKLKIHMKTHTGVKDYKCSICNKELTRKDHLKRHMLIHTGVND